MKLLTSSLILLVMNLSSRRMFPSSFSMGVGSTGGDRSGNCGGCCSCCSDGGSQNFSGEMMAAFFFLAEATEAKSSSRSRTLVSRDLENLSLSVFSRSRS